MIRYFLAFSILFSSTLVASAQWDNRQPQATPVTGYIINGQFHYSHCECSTCQHLKALEAQKEAKKKQEAPPAPKDDNPPPAPKDPEDRPGSGPLVKAEGDKIIGKVPSKEDVIKSIQDNPQIPSHVKKEILDNLKGVVPPIKEEPREDPKPKVDLTKPLVTSDPPKFDLNATTPKKDDGKFDLLEALKRSSTKPAVKAFSEDTPPFKPANPPKVDPPKVDPKDPPKVEPQKVEPKKADPFMIMPLGTGPAPEPGDTYEVPITDIGVSVGSKIDYTTPWDPTKPVPYGKILQFWVKPVAKRPDKLKSVAYTWTVLPKEDVLMWPDTTRILFSSGVKPQNYVVMLTASYVFVDGEKIVQRANQAITMIQVGDGTTVIPTPGGSGGGPIIPVPPPDLNGISKQVFEWVTSVIRTNTYTDAMVKADAKKIADVFNKVAAKIDGAQLVDITDILQTTKSENDKAFQNAAEWMPWFTKMSDLLRDGFRNNTIRTPQQYKEVWLQIAKGLDAASR